MMIIQNLVIKKVANVLIADMFLLYSQFGIFNVSVDMHNKYDNNHKEKTKADDNQKARGKRMFQR